MRKPPSIKDLLPTSHRKTTSSSGWDPLSRERCFCILIVDQMKGPNWSTIYLQKSTIYLQFALQINRRLRGRGAHFRSTIYLQSTKAMDHIKALQQIYAYVEAGDVGNAVMGCLRVAKSTPQSKRRAR